jgi:hypothetical protein
MMVGIIVSQHSDMQEIQEIWSTTPIIHHSRFEEVEDTLKGT